MLVSGVLQDLLGIIYGTRRDIYIRFLPGERATHVPLEGKERLLTWLCADTPSVGLRELRD
jgi:hypothetical protein